MLVGDVMFMDTVRFFTRHLRGSSNHIAINIFPFLSLGLEYLMSTWLDCLTGWLPCDWKKNLNWLFTAALLWRAAFEVHKYGEETTLLFFHPILTLTNCKSDHLTKIIMMKVVKEECALQPSKYLLLLEESDWKWFFIFWPVPWPCVRERACLKYLFASFVQ